MPKIKNDILPLDLQYQIKRSNLSQRDLAKHFNVTDGAISQAINNYTEVQDLRTRLIQHLNSLQRNILKQPKSKKVA